MDGYDITKHSQMRSRRFPVKSMFIGGVGHPRPKPRIRDLVMMLLSIRKSKMASGNNFMFLI